jgi:hypothetical protein
MFFLGLFSSVTSVAIILAMALRERGLRAERLALTEQLREISLRLTAVEQTLEQVGAQAEVTARVLLDKGVADEEDLDAARRRMTEPAEGEPARHRDGTVH